MPDPSGAEPADPRAIRAALERLEEGLAAEPPWPDTAVRARLDALADLFLRGPDEEPDDVAPPPGAG